MSCGLKKGDDESAEGSRVLGTKLQRHLDGEQLVIQHVSDHGFEMTLAIQARGDFNGDGFEDLMLEGMWSGGGSRSLS